MESPDSVKDEKVKNGIIDIYSLIVVKHEKGTRSTLQARVVQEYLREEHLADFVADFLVNLVKTYENTVIVDSVMKYEIFWLNYRKTSEIVFGEDSKSAKSFSKFIVQLSEGLPGQVQRGMIHLQNQVDSEVLHQEW